MFAAFSVQPARQAGAGAALQPSISAAKCHKITNPISTQCQVVRALISVGGGGAKHEIRLLAAAAAAAAKVNRGVKTSQSDPNQP